MKKNSGLVILIVGILLIFCSLYGVATSLLSPLHLNMDTDELEAERRRMMLFIIGCLAGFIMGVVIAAVGLSKIRKAKNEN